MAEAGTTSDGLYGDAAEIAVDFTLTRRDFLHLNLVMAPRMAITWWSLVLFLVLLAAVNFGANCYVCEGADSPGRAPLHLVQSILVAVALFPILFSAVLALGLLSVSRRSNMLGAHSYRIGQGGFSVISDAGRGMHGWAAIRSVIRTRSWLVIRVHGYRFHPVPARAFRSREDFERVAGSVAARVAAARSAAERS